MKSKRLVLRVPIRVTTLDAKTGETMNVSTYTKQTQLLQFVQSQTKRYRDSATFVARVLYDRKQDYYNEFEFTNATDFNKKIEPCLERDLLKQLLKDKALLPEYVQGL